MNKKTLILIICSIFLFSCFVNASNDNEKKYIIANFEIGFGNGGSSGVSIERSEFTENEEEKKIENINYYTKNNCVKKINDYLNKTNVKNSEIGKTFIYDYTPDIYTVYFCIEKNIWNSIYENKKLIKEDKQDDDYYVGQENVYKDLNDFTEKMKKCGLMHKIDADYLPTPETPVICDKYNENNPIPSKKIKDFF